MDETKAGNADSGLLAELRGGSRAALDDLFSLVYDELRELAQRQRRRWLCDYTLETTALVHEAYLKLVGRASSSPDSRAHFLALASTAMRHILCNHARDRRALKRGGGLDRVRFDETSVPVMQPEPTEDFADTLLTLDEALKRLEKIDPRRSKVVECRFFGGLSVEETAMAIGISPRTVKRDWAVAQAWLHREMTDVA